MRKYHFLSNCVESCRLTRRNIRSMNRVLFGTLRTAKFVAKSRGNNATTMFRANNSQMRKFSTTAAEGDAHGGVRCV